MVALPSIEVSQAQADRLIAAFDYAGSGVIAQAVANYKAWLINRLIEQVQLAEAERLTVEYDLARQARLNELRASLPGPVPTPYPRPAGGPPGK